MPKLIPNQADLRAPCARNLRSRGSSSNITNEQHSRQSGSSRIAEHHLKKDHIRKKRRKLAALPHLPYQEQATRSSSTARKINFSKKKTRKIGTLTSWRGAAPGLGGTVWSGNCGCCGGQGEAAWGYFIAGREREAIVSEPMAQCHGDSRAHANTSCARRGGLRVTDTRARRVVGPMSLSFDSNYMVKWAPKSGVYLISFLILNFTLQKQLQKNI